MFEGAESVLEQNQEEGRHAVDVSNVRQEPPFWATNIRASVALLTAAVLSLALAPGAQGAKAVHVNCGETITANTRLANDLTNCPGNGIIIGADDITLDLNGHTIDGDGVPVEGCPADESCDDGVVNSASENGHAFNRPGHDGVTIKNGTIQQFWEEGVFALTVRENHLRDLSLSDNVNHGVSWVQAADSRIEDTTSKGSLVGIVVGDGHDIQIEHNSVAKNKSFGILAVRDDDVRMSKNFASGAGTGFHVKQTFDSRMDHNVAADNVSGYEIENSTGVEADHNVSIGNSAGILSVTLPFLGVNANEDNVISHNVVRNNNRPNPCSDPSDTVCKVPPGTGILLVAADDNSVRHNRVTGNRSFGIAVTNICVVEQLPVAICSALDIQPDSDGTRVVSNTVTENGQNPDPSVPPLFVQDLVWDTTGVGNCWSNNVFGSSFPSPLPSC